MKMKINIKNREMESCFREEYLRGMSAFKRSHPNRYYPSLRKILEREITYFKNKFKMLVASLVNLEGQHFDLLLRRQKLYESYGFDYQEYHKKSIRERMKVVVERFRCLYTEGCVFTERGNILERMMRDIRERVLRAQNYSTEMFDKSRYLTKTALYKIVFLRKKGKWLSRYYESLLAKIDSVENENLGPLLSALEQNDSHKVKVIMSKFKWKLFADEVDEKVVLRHPLDEYLMSASKCSWTKWLNYRQKELVNIEKSQPMSVPIFRGDSNDEEPLLQYSKQLNEGDEESSAESGQHSAHKRSSNGHMMINETASILSVHPNTLRSWDRNKLFVPKNRDEWKRRLYSPQDIGVLKKIKEKMIVRKNHASFGYYNTSLICRAVLREVYGILHSSGANRTLV